MKIKDFNREKPPIEFLFKINSEIGYDLFENEISMATHVMDPFVANLERTYDTAIMLEA